MDGDLIDVIRVIRFGVRLGYKGQLDPDTGRKYAELLYAAVEQDAIASSEPVTPIELFCDAENGRGLQFWRRRGFTLIDVRPAGSRSYARFIAPPKAEADAEVGAARAEADAPRRTRPTASTRRVVLRERETRLGSDS